MDYSSDFLYVKLDDGKGNKYQGGYMDRMREGQGILTFNNGKVIEGTWKRDRLYGVVKVTYPDKSIYIGRMKQMKKEGLGYLFFKDGSRFEGQFQKGRIMGYGQYEKQGKTVKGLW